MQKLRRTLLPSFCLLAALSILQNSEMVWAAEAGVKMVNQPPPAELSGEIRNLLQPVALQVTEGTAMPYQFWPVKELALKSKIEAADKALPAIKQTALLGALLVQGSQRDYRGDEVLPGLYTVRFGLQPEDGDHLGTAEYPYFALLITAKTDQKIGSITSHEALAKASSKDRPTGHPIVFSLRPATSASVPFPSINEPLPDHKTIRLRLPVNAAESGSPTNAIFEFVYKGKAKK